MTNPGLWIKALNRLFPQIPSSLWWVMPWYPRFSFLLPPCLFRYAIKFFLPLGLTYKSLPVCGLCRRWVGKLHFVVTASYNGKKGGKDELVYLLREIFPGNWPHQVQGHQMWNLLPATAGALWSGRNLIPINRLLWESVNLTSDCIVIVCNFECFGIGDFFWVLYENVYFFSIYI